MKSLKKVLYLLALVLIASAVVFSSVQAQTETPPEYLLNVNRDFGYGGGSQIKGMFSLKVVAPQGIQSVTYLIDGVEMGTLTESPFRLQFNTTSYDYGWHDLTAEVHTTDGRILTTPARRFYFVTAEEESAATRRILFPVLGVLGGVILVVVLGQVIVFRKRKAGNVGAGTERNYGVMGGAICSKCGRPTPRHMWGLNIMVGKLDRCENCGKWSIMRAVSMDTLRAAEAAEKADAKGVIGNREKTEEEKLRELLEKSKFD